jgi:uncharacterized MAPEG superfamily protein
MTSTFNILLTTKTALMPAGVAATAGPWAMTGTRSTTGFRASAAGVDQDHTFTVLAARGAG